MFWNSITYHDDFSVKKFGATVIFLSYSIEKNQISSIRLQVLWREMAPNLSPGFAKMSWGNPKFNFLNTGDPYHAYYQHKVKEFKEGKGQEPTTGTAVAKTINLTAHQKQQEILKQVEQPFVPKDPPAEFEFVADPPSISALDL